jgi:poly(3-hydroxybutyrate) depolymerase
MVTVNGRRRAATAVLALVLVAGAAGCIPKAGTVAIPSAPQPSGCITEVGPTTKVVVTGCGGGITYNVSVPAACATHRCGLILDVHGWTMSGDIQERNTGIAAIGRSEGYIVVQPTAPGVPPSWSSSHYPLVAAFVELATQVWRVDTRRVHVTGFSQGGAMTSWMRCNRPNLFASAAPTAIAGSACANGTNMPTLYIQGHDDVFVSEAAISATIASYVNTYDLDVEVVLDERPEMVTTVHRATDPAVPTFTTILHRLSGPGVQGHCVIGPVEPNVYGCTQPSPGPHGRIVVDFFIQNPRRA